MLWHGAHAGAFDLKTAVMEAMAGFRRAGEGGRVETWEEQSRMSGRPKAGSHHLGRHKPDSIPFVRANHLSFQGRVF